MSFQLYAGTLLPGNPSYLVITDLQAQVDALTAPQNALCETLLLRWGWTDTINPSPMIRLIRRALNAVVNPGNA